jgi:hypothetical protein
MFLNNCEVDVTIYMIGTCSFVVESLNRPTFSFRFQVRFTMIVNVPKLVIRLISECI